MILTTLVRVPVHNGHYWGGGLPLNISLQVHYSLYQVVSLQAVLVVSAGVGLHAVKTIKSNKGSEVGGRALWIYDQELKR